MCSKAQSVPTVTSSDPVLESQVLWERYKKHLAVAVILIVLGVGAWGAVKISADRRENAAADALAAAKTPADYQKIIADYKGTPASETAYLFKAEAERKEKKYLEANGTLQSFADTFPKHELKGTARLT